MFTSHELNLSQWFQCSCVSHFGRFFARQFQIRSRFFWYELQQKPKLFWKDNGQKFKIGGLNVEKVFDFHQKKVKYSWLSKKKYIFFLMMPSKSSTFTPPSLNFCPLSFQNSFGFCCSSYKKNLLRIWSWQVDISPLYWYDFISVVEFPTCGSKFILSFTNSFESKNTTRLSGWLKN